jgi:hypothetical protein
MADKWTTAVYWSEVSYLVHLPFFINLSPKGYSHKTHKPSGLFTALIFVARNIINVLVALLLYGSHLNDDIKEGHEHKGIGWTIAILLIASTALYLVSYIHTRYHFMNLNRQAEIQIPIYVLSHFSLVNYCIDTPGYKVPTVKLSHFTIVAVNIIAVAIVAFDYFTVEPIQRAWWCYVGNDYENYIYGTCPPPNNNKDIFGHSTQSGICAAFPPYPYVDCTKEQITNDVLAKQITWSKIALAFTMVIYIFSIVDKITYYKVKIKEE